MPERPVRVPLVVYVDGHRSVIGSAEVLGEIVTCVTLPSNLADELFTGTFKAGDYSIGWDKTPREVVGPQSWIDRAQEALNNPRYKEKKDGA